MVSTCGYSDAGGRPGHILHRSPSQKSSAGSPSASTQPGSWGWSLSKSAIARRSSRARWARWGLGFGQCQATCPGWLQLKQRPACLCLSWRGCMRSSSMGWGPGFKVGVGRAGEVGACAGVGRGWERNGEGLVAGERGWVAWNRRHWLSRMEASRFHSAQVVGMGRRR